MAAFTVARLGKFTPSDQLPSLAYPLPPPDNRYERLVSPLTHARSVNERYELGHHWVVATLENGDRGPACLYCLKAFDPRIDPTKQAKCAKTYHVLCCTECGAITDGQWYSGTNAIICEPCYDRSLPF